MRIEAACIFALLFVGAAELPVYNILVVADSGGVYLPGGVCLNCPLNKTYNSRFLTLKIDFQAGMGLKHNLTYDIDGTYQGTIPLVAQKPEELHVVNPTTGTVQLPALPDGSHCLTIHVVCGLYGYSGANPPGAPFKETAPGSHNWEATWTHIIFFSMDSDEPYQPQLSPPPKPAVQEDLAPPVISTPTLRNKVYNTSNVPLTFTINEPVSKIEYSLDGGNNATVNGNTTLTDLSKGSHMVTIYATDLAGNVGSSGTFAFTVTEPETYPLFLNAATVVAVTALIATIAVVCLKISRLQTSEHEVN